MIKPGRHDKKYDLILTEEEVDELVYHAYSLTECFGLDDRIADYKGNWPLDLYRWDIEAIYEVYSSILKDAPNDDYPDLQSPEYQACTSLVKKVKELYDLAFSEE